MEYKGFTGNEDLYGLPVRGVAIVGPLCPGQLSLQLLHLLLEVSYLLVLLLHLVHPGTNVWIPRVEIRETGNLLNNNYSVFRRRPNILLRSPCPAVNTK